MRSRHQTVSTVEADFDRLALLDEAGWTANNHYHASLLKHVPANCENALEIGCGTGAFSQLLALRSKRVVGLDLSSEMIRVAQARASHLDNLEFQLADVMTWDFPRAHFDFICSIATLHHLSQRQVLLKMRDALKPGGVIVLLDLVESNSFVERMVDVIAIGVSGSLRLFHNGRLKPPAEVRKAWEEHGQHDHYLTMDQVRHLADELLPHSAVQRRLLWRYTLVYKSSASLRTK